MVPPRPLISLWVVALLAFAHVRPAAACVTCESGDPTLTVMGSGQPLRDRLRVSWMLEGHEDRLVATGAAETLLLEGRSTFSAAYSPDDRFTLSASVPVVIRDIRFANDAHYTTVGPGDLELRGRFVWLRDRPFAPQHLFGPTLGLRLPTSIDQVDGRGSALPVDAQTGSGTFIPMGGFFYAHFADPWALFASFSVSLPVEGGRFRDYPGPSMRSTLAAQYRLDDHVTFRLGTDVRLDAPLFIDGQRDPSSEHMSWFVSPDLLWSPVPDWILQLGVQAPFAQVSGRRRREGPYVRCALTVDLRP